MNARMQHNDPFLSMAINSIWLAITLLFARLGLTIHLAHSANMALDFGLKLLPFASFGLLYFVHRKVINKNFGEWKDNNKALFKRITRKKNES